MQFNSIHFMMFFPVVIVVYFVAPRKCRMPWLLAASYYFYMSWNPRYVLLILFSTIATWICGILLERANQEKFFVSKRVIAAICLLTNLAILVFFKYGNFTLETLDALAHITGFSGGDVQMRIPYRLPVGISFYTFQALGYTIDVYRREIQAERNLFRYALFVAFFPQLVAGPIERSKNLLEQMQGIEKLQLWNGHRIASGAVLMVWGFFMKMVVADRAAILVDQVFKDYQMYGSIELSLAAILFAIQIYCDFASYSMIAIGAARVMGFTLMENFRQPYLSKSVTEFWRRWHISLSTWFRDYIYIPLGGSRRSLGRNLFNLTAVWLLTGLWHGASWNFVLWGAWFLALLAGERYLWGGGLRRAPGAVGWLYTMLAAVFSWVLFRSPSLSYALGYFGAMFGLGGGADGQEVYFLLEYWPEWIGALLAILPWKLWLQERLEERGDALSQGVL